MATTSNLPLLFLAIFCLLVPLHGQSLVEDEVTLVELSSFLSSSICSPSAPIGSEENGRASLRLVHRYGPCSNIGPSPLSLDQRLSQDAARAHSISTSAAASLPAHDGSIAAAPGDFIATISLGTPQKSLNLIIDTTSDLVWTNCKSSAGYNPAASTTFSNVSCERAVCNRLSTTPRAAWNCDYRTCTYSIRYTASSFSKGLFVYDTLTIGSDTIPEFYFGCSQIIKGKIGAADGILGLGRDTFSISTQTEVKYDGVFTYCLPSKTSFVGKLSFGKSGISNSVKYTPLLTKSTLPSLYVIKIDSITVAGKKVVVGALTFVDSGTMISRLPKKVFEAVKAAFKAKVGGRYPEVKGMGVLDTCYDVRGVKKVVVPKVSLEFGGGVVVELDHSGILFGSGLGRMCLAFAASEKGEDVAVLGNVQQQTLQVVFDVVGGRIGFAAHGCS